MSDDAHLRCPFCGGALTVTEHETQSSSETGGLWIVTDYACGSCEGAVRHDVTFKIGSGRERWDIRRAPARVEARGRLHCPACDGLLVSAAPPDALPEPATGMRADLVPSNTREYEHVCASCGERYELREHVESQWTRDAAIIVPPRRLPR